MVRESSEFIVELIMCSRGLRRDGGDGVHRTYAHACMEMVMMKVKPSLLKVGKPERKLDFLVATHNGVICITDI